MPEQPQFSSSATRQPSSRESSGPPSSAGTCRFISPTSCAFAITSAGWVMCTSYSAARGRISFSAKSCASSRSARCSSVIVKLRPSASAVAIVSSSFD